MALMKKMKITKKQRLRHQNGKLVKVGQSQRSGVKDEAKQSYCCIFAVLWEPVIYNFA